MSLCFEKLQINGFVVPPVVGGDLERFDVIGKPKAERVAKPLGVGTGRKSPDFDREKNYTYAALCVVARQRRYGVRMVELRDQVGITVESMQRRMDALVREKRVVRLKRSSAIFTYYPADMMDKDVVPWVSTGKEFYGRKLGSLQRKIIECIKKKGPQTFKEIRSCFISRTPSTLMGSLDGLVERGELCFSHGVYSVRAV